MDIQKLNKRHLRFCKEYPIDFNGTRAAADSGFSKKTAAAIASRLLRNVKIQEQIQKEIKAREYRTEVTADRVIQEIALLGFSDIAHYIEIGEDGQITTKTFEEMPEHASRAIESISEDRIIRENPDGTQIIVHDKYKFKLHSKIHALEKLFKHLGLAAEERLRFGIEGVDGQPIEFTIKYVHTNGGKPTDSKEAD